MRNVYSKVYPRTIERFVDACDDLPSSAKRLFVWALGNTRSLDRLDKKTAQVVIDQLVKQGRADLKRHPEYVLCCQWTLKQASSEIWSTEDNSQAKRSRNRLVDAKIWFEARKGKRGAPSVFLWLPLPDEISEGGQKCGLSAPECNDSVYSNWGQTSQDRGADSADRGATDTPRPGKECSLPYSSIIYPSCSNVRCPKCGSTNVAQIGSTPLFECRPCNMSFKPRRSEGGD